VGAKVDSQVAAPAEMKDAQLAPSETIAQQKSADGRMATEAARLKRKKTSGKKKIKPT